MSAVAQLAPVRRASRTARVAVVGNGAIGSTVIRELAAGAVAGAQLVAVVDNRPVVGADVPQLSLAQALETCDVIVECAGQQMVAQHGVHVLEQGADLLVTSVGALADPLLAERLLAAGPGRLLFTSGAVGGIDLLVSATAGAPMRSVLVTTTKLPGSLVQPWMDQQTRQRILASREPIEVFRGGAREAAKSFPRSLNVAATVALAVGDFDLVDVVLVADPAAELTNHLIEADGGCGQYRFEIRNHPSPGNPRTSGIVPFAVLRSLSVLLGRPVRIV
ncbi:MAG: aspartate dehydrogenase domain-containing protein [Haloechinothrix sp.]